MAKDEKIEVKLTRKQTAPRNLAARALKEGQFQPKVEEDPRAIAGTSSIAGILNLMQRMSRN